MNNVKSENVIKEVPLHPESNSGEAATALISFCDRTLSMTLNLQGYGNHASSVIIGFNSPEVMRELGTALIETSNIAKAFFIQNP